MSRGLSQTLAALTLLWGIGAGDAWSGEGEPESAPGPETVPESLPVSETAPESSPTMEAVPESLPAAEESPPRRLDFGPRYAVSLNLFALRAAAVAVDAERTILTPRLSARVGLGIRFGGGGDYRWLGLGASVGARFYFWGRGPIRHSSDPGMVGPFVGARVDFEWGRLRDPEAGRTVGAVVSLSEVVTAGWRLSWWGRMETTLVLGAGVRHDFDVTGRLAPLTLPVLLYGLTVGYLFGR